MKKLLNNHIVKEVFEIFEDHEIYVVGGAVRDTILNRDITDIDFATNLLPDEVEELAKKKGYRTLPVGKHFGTIIIVLKENKSEEVQITTYRRKEKYGENDRHPTVEYGRIIEEDLQRRDFTINAMAVNNEKFADPFNGKQDLEAGILRTPQPSGKTFKDDPLRMLRAVRFVSKYNFKIDEATYKGIVNNANRILSISIERVKMELDKLLEGDFVATALQLLLDTRLINYILPELTILPEIEQDEEYHHKDVWEHTKLVVQQAPKSIRWAALLHDIAKPYTTVIDRNGIHFYHHEEVGAKLANSIFYRLRFSNHEKDKMVFIIKNHMRPNLYNNHWSSKAVRKFRKEMGKYLEDIIAMSKADITSQHPGRVQSALELLDNLKERCLEEPAPVTVCPISGDVIMKEFNLEPGKLIGELKDKVIEAIDNERLPIDGQKDVYLNFVRKILNDTESIR